MKTYKKYSELKHLETFEERFNYLKLQGSVGDATFGFDRYLNQTFYRSKEWKSIRNMVILRDMGCDLGIQNRPIPNGVLIHHMNPIEVSDIEERNELILNPEFLICVSHETHNAIHYGSSESIAQLPIFRKSGDTKLW